MKDAETNGNIYVANSLQVKVINSNGRVIYFIAQYRAILLLDICNVKIIIKCRALNLKN